MKTNRPFWYAIISFLLYVVIIVYIFYPLLIDGMMVVTRNQFVLVAFLGIIFIGFFANMIRYEWWGIPMETRILREGVLFQVTIHKIVYVGKYKKIIHLLYVEYDDEENYDTEKHIPMQLENHDLENPALFTDIQDWGKTTFFYSNSKVRRAK